MMSTDMIKKQGKECSLQCKGLLGVNKRLQEFFKFPVTVFYSLISSNFIHIYSYEVYLLFFISFNIYAGNDSE